MTYKYIINGEVVPKKNSRITLKNGKTIPSSRFTTWHIKAQAELYLQSRPEKPINSECIINFVLYHSNNARRDSDNQISSILDLLQDVYILEDDRWQIVKEIKVSNCIDKEKPRCEITILTI